MQKQPLSSGMGWLGVFGVTMMLVLTACESAVVPPVPALTKPINQTSTNNDDPPEKPIKPPGS